MQTTNKKVYFLATTGCSDIDNITKLSNAEFKEKSLASGISPMTLEDFEARWNSDASFPQRDKFFIRIIAEIDKVELHKMLNWFGYDIATFSEKELDVLVATLSNCFDIEVAVRGIAMLSNKELEDYTYKTNL